MELIRDGTDTIRSLWQTLALRSNNRGRGRRLFLLYCVLLIPVNVQLTRILARGDLPLGGSGDFVAFYTAAHMVRNGNAGRLYDLTRQARVQQHILNEYGGGSADGLLPYINPPHLAIILVPLSYLSLAWAFYAWNIVNIMLILASVGLLLRYQGRPPKDIAITSLVVFAFLPVLQGLVNGQSTFLILFALTLTYLALKSERDGLAGVTLAFGLVKPQLVLVVAGILLYRRRWRAVTTFGIGAGLLLMTNWGIMGTDGMISYVKLMREIPHWNNVYGVHLTHMPNLRGTIYRFQEFCQAWLEMDLSYTMLGRITLLLTAGLLVFVIGVWRGPWDVRSPSFDLRFAHAIIGSLLLSPHLNGQDLSLLILVGFLTTDYFAATGKPTHTHTMIAVGHSVTFLSGIAVGATGQAQAVVLLLASFLIVLQREERRATYDIPKPRWTERIKALP